MSLECKTCLKEYEANESIFTVDVFEGNKLMIIEACPHCKKNTRFAIIDQDDFIPADWSLII